MITCDVVFEAMPQPKNNLFSFQVTEVVNYNNKILYLTYLVRIPADKVNIIQLEDGKFFMSVKPEVFDGLENRSRQLHTEILVYPYGTN